jgi:predicted amidophosphoribosyltransferase
MHDAGEQCLACTESPPPHKATVVWGEYDGVLRTAILALKHGGRDDLAVPLGDRLAALVSVEPWAPGIDLVVPVPSHPWRRLRKPWTASELLARRVARRIERPLIPILRRHGFGRQARRTRARRLQLPRTSFSARSELRGQAVLLIDDVTTTGTTLRRAADVLLSTGAVRVFCAVCAQAPDSRRLS